MRLFKKITSFLLIFLFWWGTGSIFAGEKGDFSTAPTTNNGKRWRIGYYEGGEYFNYQKCLIATVMGLTQLGWIEPLKIPPQEGVQTEELWNWLTINAKSEYIQFIEDAHFTAGWDAATRKKMSAEIIERLNQKADIDLMIAMGTRAGQGLANVKHHTPTMVLSTSDPIASGIIKSNEDSGFDHVHARIDPFRYERQIQLFYDIIGFQKLGVAYENTDAGRTYAAIDKVEKVANEAGFRIIRCYTRKEDETVTLSRSQEEERLKKCFHEFREKADAIYVTQHTGINSNSVPELVKIANSSRLPTFSQGGSKDVKSGFLMSISRINFKYDGLFYAETIAKVFNGAKPRQLDQVFEAPTSISINLKTAKIIGYDPPLDVMAIADEVYHEIQKPKK